MIYDELAPGSRIYRPLRGCKPPSPEVPPEREPPVLPPTREDIEQGAEPDDADRREPS